MKIHSKNSPWFYYAKKYGEPNVLWNEKIVSSWVVNPINTYTNIFYILVGIYILSQRRFPIFGIASIILGICSGLYHASVIYPTQLADIYSMNFLLAIIASKQLNTSINYLVILFFFITYLFIKFGVEQQASTGLLILIMIFTAPKYNKKFYSSILLLFVGFFFSFLDLKGLIGKPEDFIQGHSLWHFFSAMAILQWYFYSLDI